MWLTKDLLWDEQTDPVRLLNLTAEQLRSATRFLLSQDDWQATVKKPRDRNMMFDQLLLAQLVLDRVCLLLLELPPGGWSQPPPNRRRSIPRRR